jgi:hypothetical protein
MAKGTRKQWLLGSTVPAYPVRFCTTTEGRQELPNILQDSFGMKSITGVHRYGRMLGAIIPMDAVRLLAGFPDAVDDETRLRIKNAALNLLENGITFVRGVHGVGAPNDLLYP